MKVLTITTNLTAQLVSQNVIAIKDTEEKVCHKKQTQVKEGSEDGAVFLVENNSLKEDEKPWKTNLQVRFKVKQNSQ